MPEKVLKVGDKVWTTIAFDKEDGAIPVEGIVESIVEETVWLSIPIMKMRSVPFSVRRTIGEIE